MKHWFSSDWHLFHKRVIEHSRRPFSSLEEMHEKLVDNWNACVEDGDFGYILGDFSFSRKVPEVTKIIRRLKGSQIHLILGNHDSKMKPDIRNEFDSVEHLKEIKIPDADAYQGMQRIVLCHFPMLVWNKSHYGSFMLHGHSHGSLKEDPHSLRQDVGVDVFDYKPVEYQQIKNIMKTKTFKPVDHHEPKQSDVSR